MFVKVYCVSIPAERIYTVIAHISFNYLYSDQSSVNCTFLNIFL